MDENSWPHTPGDWEVGPDATHPMNKRVFVKGGKSIAKVYASAMNDDGAAAANANLIACAPELLAALCWARDALKRASEGHPDPYEDQCIASANAIIERAIS